MSACRDSLPDEETRARYDQAVAAAGVVLARALADVAVLSAERGALAAAQAAWYPGHPLGSPEAIAARYEQLHGRREDAAQAA